MIVWGCSGCVILSMEANVVATCWYSGCSFMVFGIKYVFVLFFCVAGCVRRIFGIGPGFSSISPHFSSSNLLMKWYPLYCSVFGFSYLF